MSVTSQYDPDRHQQPRFPRLHCATTAVRRVGTEFMVTALGAVFGASLMLGVFFAPLPPANGATDNHTYPAPAQTPFPAFGFTETSLSLARADEAALAQPVPAAPAAFEPMVEATTAPADDFNADIRANPGPEPEAIATTAKDPAQAKTPVQDEPVRDAATPLKASKVVLHYVRGAAGTRAGKLHMKLLNAGFKHVEASYVTFDIARSQIRYYFAQDRQRARAIQKLAGSGQQFEVRDFTEFSPRPAPGLVEIWMR